MKTSILLLILFLTVFLNAQGNSEDSLRTVSVKLFDGSFYKGTLIHSDSMSINLNLSEGVNLSIPKENVKEIIYLKEEKPITEMNEYRLLLSPTARHLKKRQRFFGSTQILFFSGGYGFTDDVMVTGGFFLFPITGLLFVAPQARLYSEGSVNFSIGGLYALTGVTKAINNPLTALYGITTLSGRRLALNVGGGVVYLPDNPKPDYVIMVAGELSVSDKNKIIIETWTTPKVDGMFVMAGFRMNGESFSADFGALRVFSRETVQMPFIPWLNVTFMF